MSPRKKAAAGPLGTHHGYPVTILSVAFRGGGDGLSKSLAIDPIPTEPGSTNYWLLKTVAGPDDFNPIDKKGKRVKPVDLAEEGFEAYERVEDHSILLVSRVPDEMAEPIFAELEERIAAMVADAERAERAANGTLALNATEEEEAKAKAAVSADA